MRLAAQHGPWQAVTRPRLHFLTASSHLQHRTINTRPKSERLPPIIEQINLRPQPNPRAQSIGILGGGITGLTTAWHLQKFLPEAKITIYEKQDRLGGWLNSEVVKVDDGEVLFEWGPRNLRPDTAGSGRATVLLLLQLGLGLTGIGKTSPAAVNRFIYYDNKLVKMPGPNPRSPMFVNAIRNGYKLLTEPIFKGVLGSAFAENWVKSRPQNMTDESIGDFIRRRFGKTAADNLASALIHGIYAGDLYKLSARTLLPALWHMETRDPEGAGILMEMADIAFKGQGLMQYKHGRYVDLVEAVGEQVGPGPLALMQTMHSDISVYTFGRGLQQLSDKLLEGLKEKNVAIHTNTEVWGLEFDPQSKRTKVRTNGNKEESHDYIVSSLSAGHLARSLKHSATARGAKVNTNAETALKESDKSVNVAVVNLYYDNPNLIPAKYRGFGYLIPRSVDLDQNPERALGVIFGSESSGTRGKDAVQRVQNSWKESLGMAPPDLAAVAAKLNPDKSQPVDETSTTETSQETKANPPEEEEIRLGQDTAPGTKLTVMLGGHWWDSWSKSDLPSEEQCIEMAITVLTRHLKLTEAPAVAKAKMNYDCIPQYSVGYRQRMASVHHGLMEEFQGRLKVAGPWWQGGVGVNDCVLSAHMTAFNIREEWDDETGLKDYTEKEKWLICDRRTQTFTMDQGR